MLKIEIGDIFVLKDSCEFKIKIVEILNKNKVEIEIIETDDDIFLKLGRKFVMDVKFLLDKYIPSELHKTEVYQDLLDIDIDE